MRQFGELFAMSGPAAWAGRRRAVELHIRRVGTEFVEKQKTLVKIPDLKDVHIYEALRLLKEELNLTPTSAIANPSLAYADESENEVMYSEPRFGSWVNPKTTVKVCYLTQDVGDRVWLYYVNEEVISESKSLKDKKDNGRQERIDKVAKVTKDVSKGIYTGVADVSQNLAKNIEKPFTEKKASSDKSEE